MKLLIADDHDLVRESIAAVLEQEADTTVVTAADLDSALDAIRNDGEFDLVLLDYNMPGMLGLSGFETAISEVAGKNVALMSGDVSKQVVEQALAAGAAGFVPKTLSAKSMVNAVKFMVAGEVFAPVDFMTAPDQHPENPLASLLSEREQQVLRGLCEGKSNKEIARDYDLQEVTIKLHVRTLCRKIEARNRTHAAMIARDKQFI